MMTRLYLIRHGETVANREKRYLGRSNSQLTTRGNKQYEEIIRQMDRIAVDHIFTSPAERCCGPAQMLANIKALPAVVDERIAEMNFGILEMLTWTEAEQQHPAEYAAWCADPVRYRLPQGESQDQLDQRTADFIQNVAPLGRNIAVFSHGGAIMSMIAQALHLSPEQKWRFRVNPGTVVTLIIDGEYAYIEL